MRTVEEYFEDGLVEGNALYRLRGPSIMRSLTTIGATRDNTGPILEPIDLDALTRGIRAGIVRANRAANGLPEICDVRGCGAGSVCNSCKEFRRRNS